MYHSISIYYRYIISKSCRVHFLLCCALYRTLHVLYALVCLAQMGVEGFIKFTTKENVNSTRVRNDI
ncbi:hypothetical protein QVD17_15146 [Tagetes erecta]|uniref:Uncharacterized protein n=1 Tax=Tagetes erecta TaxID=13708 RepID=A0AAD8KP57_TARER|nr:hypothetical protein QVD17_15146 [Tagetes erecta]